MPIKVGRRKYKSFGRAVGAIRRTRGLSKKRASAYVAAVSRAQGIDPRSHKKIRRIPTTRTRRSRKRRR